MSKPKSTRRRKGQSAEESTPSGSTAASPEYAADAEAAPVVAASEPAPPAEAAPAAPAPVTMELAAGLEIKDVESVHRRLSAALAGASALTVNLGRIATIDTAGVQLLLALRRSAGLERMPLTFTGESAALSQALGVLGLEDALHAGAPGE